MEENFHVTFLRDKDYAFKDVKNRIIYDLPSHFEGALMLKTNFDYNYNSIKFN
jgi:hypothetical protein